MAQEGYAGGGSGKTQAALNLSVECSEGGFASERWCERPVLPSAENWVERRTGGPGWRAGRTVLSPVQTSSQPVEVF